MINIDRVAYDNKVLKRHPLEKFIFSMVTLLFVLLSQSYVMPIFSILLMNFYLLLKARIKGKTLLSMYLIPSIFILTSLIPLLISLSFESGFVLGFSSSGFIKAKYLLLKSISSISCFYCLILTTPIDQIDFLMENFKVPLLFRELMLLIYRYIFVLSEFSRQIFLSQKQRLGYKNFRISIRSTALLCSSILSKSLAHSKRAHLALLARGGEGNFVFFREEMALNKRNICILMIYSFALIFLKLGEIYWL